MGWYLKKSFSAGPVRFNLSKSGIGYSFGVKGARIGVGPRGAYTHVGAGGIYHRQSLSTGSQRESNKVGVKTITRDASVQSSSAALFDNTQINEKRLGIEFNIKTSAKEYWICFGASIFAFYTAGADPFKNQIVAQVFAFLGLGLFLTIPCIWLNRVILKYRARNLYKKLVSVVLKKANQFDIDGLRLITEKVNLPNGHRSLAYSQLYQDCLKTILSDHEINESEARDLEKVEQVLNLDESLLKKIRQWAFNRTYLDIIEDQILTEKEDADISRAKYILKLDDEDVEDELETLAVLRTVRQIQKEELLPVKVSAKLSDSEDCYHQTKGRLLKEKVVRTYQVAGERYKDKDLTIEREGDLYLTSERIMLVGEGVYSIKLEKILGIETDIDKNMIALNVDGRKTPVQITVPDSYVFSAKLNKLHELHSTLE